MHKKILLTASAACIITLTSCGKPSDMEIKPMLGIDWFTSYDDVKDEMDGYTLIDERESDTQDISQKMLDYTGIELFDYTCDLTLCFTDSGLIGFNYHDVNRNQGYRDWYSTLESTYGLPTEEGSGMASWYDDPVGKETAIYLFNLEEGVQVSIYATSDSPDKSYEKKDEYVPTPEIRTPVVPVTEEKTTNNSTENKTTDDKVVTTVGEFRDDEVQNVIGTDIVGNYIVAVTDVVGEVVTDKVGGTVTTVIPATSVATDKDGKPTTTTTAKGETTDKKSSTTAKNGSTETTTVAVEDQTEPEKEDKSKAFLLNGLKFYSSPDSERRKMNRYTQLYEYRTEEPGQPWELIMEYENVPYLGKNCDGVLCFTSLGLVGVNYFDSNTNDYNYWVQQLTEIYGSPTVKNYGYTAWSDSPVGNGTMIYVFALEDGVQISFFADDTGSELA